MIRAVIDTSILVRTLIRPQGTIGPVLQGLRSTQYQLVYSDSILAELGELLAKPRLRAKYGLTTEDIEAVLSLIPMRREAAVPGHRLDICRDATDNMLLEAALAGRADVIVSGDKDLLALNPFAGIPILSPPAFLRMLPARRRT